MKKNFLPKIIPVIMLVLVAVTSCEQPTTDNPSVDKPSGGGSGSDAIINLAFINAVELSANNPEIAMMGGGEIGWKKEPDGTVKLTPENLEKIRAVKALDLSCYEGEDDPMFDSLNKEKLKDFSDIRWFTGLEYLFCFSNEIEELDLSSNTALMELYCSYNNISSLDLSSNTALTYLDCSDNNISSLDLSSNTALMALDCSYNNISSLDLTQNAALTEVNCRNNKLEELNVAGCSELDSLECQNNQLTSLVLPAGKVFRSLYCYSNRLTQLDVTGYPGLEFLYCGLQTSDGTTVQDLALTMTGEMEKGVWKNCKDYANNSNVNVILVP